MVALALAWPVDGLLAQKGVEGGLQGMATFADFDFAGGGAHGAIRGGRTRFMVSATAGAIDSDFALRGEVTGQFLLNPRSPHRGFYAGGGLAGLTGPVDEGYLLLLVGLEWNPGGSGGWVIEAGIGGGVRVMLGYRWRNLRR